MLAIFGSTVANAPQELSSPCSSKTLRESRKSGIEILEIFMKEMPDAVQITLSDVTGLAYTHDKQSLLAPRSFAMTDGVFCLIQGALENLTALRQEYGLPKNVNEVMFLIQAYKTLRDRGPFPADRVLAALSGRFFFVLFDTINLTVFVAQDCEGSIPLYWGTTEDSSLAFSDKPAILKASCGKSFAPFPPEDRSHASKDACVRIHHVVQPLQGCFFSSNMRLRSYEHPLQMLKPVPRVDSHGEALGATFKVDMAHRGHDTAMPRVGSEVNWAQCI